MEDTKCSKCGHVMQVGDWPFCGENGHESTYSLNAQRFDPVVVFQDANGNHRVPGRSDVPTPAGYQRVELKTLAEVRRFEREVGVKSYQRHELAAAKDSAACEAARAKLRGELRMDMQQMSEKGRDFARFAMQQTNDRPRKRYSSDAHLEVFS